MISLKFKSLIIFIFFAFSIFGCSARTYTVQKDRVDQDLSSGNRGYAQDRAPEIDEVNRKKTRAHTMIEIEIGKPVKATSSSSATVASEEKPSEETVAKPARIK
ncbi:MAG: hypothetical protein AB1472_05505 [Candidatus Omnitrophota bacterium]